SAKGRTAAAGRGAVSRGTPDFSALRSATANAASASRAGTFAAVGGWQRHHGGIAPAAGTSGTGARGQESGRAGNAAQPKAPGAGGAVGGAVGFAAGAIAGRPCRNLEPEAGFSA